jgi:hypothetical protein
MPAKFQPKLQKDSDMTMKVMSAASYLTYGIAGLIYVIANGRYSKNMFFRFHFVQAILLSIFNTFISWTGSALGNTLGGILGLFGPAAAGASGVLGTGLGLRHARRSVNLSARSNRWCCPVDEGQISRDTRCF